MLVLTACGDDNTATSTTNPGTATTNTPVNGTSSVSNTAPSTGAATAAPNSTAPQTTAATTRAPVQLAPTPTVPPGLKDSDQTLNITGGEVSNFDPALVSDVDNSFVQRQIYSGLVSLDKNLKVVPDLAVALPDVSADGTVYTFSLRHGVKFHSGKELTAEDIKYSWERATDPALAAPASADRLPAATYMNDIVGVPEKLAGKAKSIEGVTVKDPYTLEVKIDGPKPYFLAKLTYTCFLVVNKDSVAKGFDQPDGSGPFKLLEFKKDQLIRLGRNPDYYNGPAKLNQVNILMGAAAASPLTLYEQGKIDFTFLGGNEIERALDKNTVLNRELVVKPQLDVTYVAFNNKVKPFDDAKVRQAFSLVIDRERIARAMFENKVKKADTILPPGMPGYTGNPGPLVYDVNKARDLIAQSSYRSPQNLPKITLISTGTGLARVLQDVYRQAFGIELEVQQPDYQDFQGRLASKQFQIYISTWVADYPDPENFLRALLGTGSALNDCGYSNPQFDDMMKQADQLSDSQKRLDMYGKAEQIALADAPILPISHSINYLVVKPYVKGLDLTASGILSLKDVYIVK